MRTRSRMLPDGLCFSAFSCTVREGRVKAGAGNARPLPSHVRAAESPGGTAASPGWRGGEAAPGAAPAPGLRAPRAACGTQRVLAGSVSRGKGWAVGTSSGRSRVAKPRVNREPLPVLPQPSPSAQKAGEALEPFAPPEADSGKLQAEPRQQLRLLPDLVSLQRGGSRSRPRSVPRLSPRGGTERRFHRTPAPAAAAKPVERRGQSLETPSSPPAVTATCSSSAAGMLRLLTDAAF